MSYKCPWCGNLQDLAYDCRVCGEDEFYKDNENTGESNMDSFYMMDNEKFAGEVQYAQNIQSIEEYYEDDLYAQNTSLAEFVDEWELIDADDIQNDSRLRHNLLRDIERGVIYDDTIVALIEANTPVSHVDN